MLKLRGQIQQEAYKLLVKDGKIENLGKTYRSFSSSPRCITNKQILNFIDRVKQVHDLELVRGSKGGLDTALVLLKGERR